MTAVAAARGIFALARCERLPKQLTSISQRGTHTDATAIVLFGYVVVTSLVLWSTSFAIPGLPEYVAVFSWMSTYGGSAITIIDLPIAVCAQRGLKSHPLKAKLFIAGAVAIMVAECIRAMFPQALIDATGEGSVRSSPPRRLSVRGRRPRRRKLRTARESKRQSPQNISSGVLRPAMRESRKPTKTWSSRRRNR